MRQTDRSYKFDWITILIFLALVTFGWFNIFSASSTLEVKSYFDLGQPYGKQLIFIILTVVIIVIILSLEAKFYERFSSVIYILSLISLLGLFLFGKTVSGATSWYGIGGMTLQPSEFAKAATALAVAKYISDMQTNIKVLRDQIRLFIIILIPAILILLQNDTGSTVVYGAFFFVLFREGLPRVYLYLAALFPIAAILVLKFGIVLSSIIIIVLIIQQYILAWVFCRDRLYPHKGIIGIRLSATAGKRHRGRPVPVVRCICNRPLTRYLNSRKLIIWVISVSIGNIIRTCETHFSSVLVICIGICLFKKPIIHGL